MKKTFITLFAISVILFSSCYKLHTLNFGFNSPIEENGSGLSIMDISGGIDFVYLTGRIELNSGSVHVSLLDPDSFAVFDTTFNGPSVLMVNETYDARTGYWKLQYTSDNGTGKIDLHVNY